MIQIKAESEEVDSFLFFLELCFVFKFYLFISYIWVYVCNMPGQKRVLETLELGFELPCRCWELNPGLSDLCR